MAESHRVTAPGGTRHTGFCMKVTPVVGEAGSAGELRQAWTTVVPCRILDCIAEWHKSGWAQSSPDSRQWFSHSCPLESPEEL